MRLDPETCRVLEAERTGRGAGIVGVIGLGLSAVGFFVDSRQFFFSYLVAFIYWLTVALGGLFLTQLHHLVGAKWSVVLRRIFETVMSLMPIMVLFFLPVLFGIHELYHWSHGEAIVHDKILQAKSGFLNIPFFIVRSLIYISVWVVFSLLLHRCAVRELEGRPGIAGAMKRLSAPGMLLFAFTLTFASYDWIMSLDPHWYSTIFGVYIFGGTIIIILTFTTFIALTLRERGILHEIISAEHYHDLGKLLFSFTVFWAYIAFAQFFLIWYANIPEETVWYLKRWEGSWKNMSLLLLAGHFILPFLILIGRAAKRNHTVLKLMTYWFFFIHWVDLYWLILPPLHPQGLSLSWMDATTWFGLGGIFVWLFWRRFLSNPILVVGDVNLEASKNHHS